MGTTFLYDADVRVENFKSCKKLKTKFISQTFVGEISEEESQLKARTS